jgi:RNA recognition motif-containing protein
MTNIYVGNMSYDATEDDLRQAFSKFGQVASVNIIMDRETGRPHGFGFVEMPDANEAQNAIQSVNEQEIAGRPVKVNEARPKGDRSSGGRQDRW